LVFLEEYSASLEASFYKKSFSDSLHKALAKSALAASESMMGFCSSYDYE